MTRTRTPPRGWRLTAAAGLLPGDEVTETGTSDGPTYLVANVDVERRLLVLDDGVEVPLGPPHALVLARRPSPRS